jgi:lipid A 3-O-deacylase
MRQNPAILLILLFMAPFASAQTSQNSGVGDSGEIFKRGTTEWSLHSGGGFAVAGGVQDETYWMLVGRWGKILTHEIGSGPLKGDLQYSVEVIPVMIMSQSTKVYAAGFSPLELRYNFIARQRIVPFFEIGGFVLPSAEKIPEGASHFNFLTFGGPGFHYLIKSKSSLQFGMRFQHISNAGIVDNNPGINSIYLYAGISLFR